MFKNILVPIDITKESSWTSIFPFAIAQAEKFDSKLNVMTVLDLKFVKMMNLVQADFGINAYKFPKDFRDEYMGKIEKQLEILMNERIPKNIETECFVREGKAYAEILTAAKELKADLIIIKASHQSAIKEYVLGGNSSQVMRYAKCPVLIVRNA